MFGADQCLPSLAREAFAGRRRSKHGHGDSDTFRAWARDDGSRRLGSGHLDFYDRIDLEDQQSGAICRDSSRLLLKWVRVERRQWRGAGQRAYRGPRRLQRQPVLRGGKGFDQAGKDMCGALERFPITWKTPSSRAKRGDPTGSLESEPLDRHASLAMTRM
jgi:hypothetical protein